MIQRRERKGALRARLKAWQEELKTDKHGYAHLAESAIASIQAELKKQQRNRNKRD